MGVARYAPLSSIALLIGSQAGRPGVLTQCSAEEATELELGIRGLTTYAETLSVYGTEKVFIDGDDTPYSKAFLNSAYASRGLKVRFTSGSGSEVLMGNSEKKSMLYLECRCLYATKGAGSQGIQNGSVSCIGVPGAVPGGIREVIGENLVAALFRIGMRFFQRPELLQFRYAQDCAHDAAVFAGYGFHFLGICRRAELRQHVRGF